MAAAPPPPDRAAPPPAVHAVILAGGQGRRMGGVDKGLVPLRGEPMIAHVIRRLRPQVDRLAISANRNLDTYRAFGLPVVPDAVVDAGPLGGVLEALCRSPEGWLLTVPCDSPDLPDDLASRLCAALAAAPSVAAAVVTADGRLHPVFSLYRAGLAPALERYLDAGTRSLRGFLESIGCVQVEFRDPAAFTNVNTAEELARLERATAGRP